MGVDDFFLLLPLINGKMYGKSEMNYFFVKGCIFEVSLVIEYS